jgi:outer membrane receptor protein involved in Fe transport
MRKQIMKSAIVSISTILLTSPVMTSAQVLEEVIVTAQRREQSLQEVPISIESFGGAEIQQQGYRNLDDLANFSATVLVDDDDFLSTERSVRGFGSSGNALTVEQAVPIFLDGIHHGRPGQVKNAFMDVQSVEVLKGPQPVYFGMSATAGAFNIRSAGPTAEWEGYIDSELGNIGKGAIEAAIGGPISDNWGIRVAGKYETRDGFMKDVVDGRSLGDYENLGGRITLQWTPTDDFQATLKAEFSQIEKFPEARHICLTEGTLLYRRNDQTQPGYPTGPERAVFADAPKGAGWSQPTDIDYDCFGSNKGISSGGPWFAPPLNIHEEGSDAGAIDAREALDGFNKALWEQTDGRAGSPYGIVGIEKIDNEEGSLDLNYTLDNGIEVNSLTGYSYFKRLNWRDNSDSPFLLNQQDRVEIFHQVSQELRFTSPSGGTIEWMAGLFWQKTGYDITSNSATPGVRQGLRYNDIIREDQEWKTAFANITFNFLDDRASIDLGGRYIDLDKSGAIAGVAGQFIFDEMPCATNRDDRTTDWLGPVGQEDRFDPDVCTPDPMGVQIAAADAAFLVDDADTANLWILDYGGSRNTPPNWRSPLTSAVGIFIYPNRDTNTIGGPRNGSALRRTPFVEGRVEDGVDCCNFGSSEFDPQVTLRYRVNDDHSVFARWAQAFKAAGFDTGVTTINATVEDFRFDAENAETYEVGAKGTLFDGAARYDITWFRTDFNNFQITVPTGNPNDPFLNSNAGKQRATGVEFGYTHALTENLTLGLAGAWLNGEMKYFPAGGCTPIEARTAPGSGCVLDDPSDPDSGGTIDRSGEEAPKSPDYKLVMRLDYWMPVFNDYKATWNFQGYVSDGYLTDVNGFSKEVKMNKHEDINMSLGVGDMDDTWNLSVYGRNLLEARKSYNEEFDVVPSGFLGSGMGPSNFLTYGVKFRYNFQ